MINGDAGEFIAGLHYGDERFFLFNGCKYFVQGYCDKGLCILEVYCMESSNDFCWKTSRVSNYPVEQFENAPIWNGKTFWEVEQDIEWVDC